MKTILFSGGVTLGSVSPLIAVMEKLKEQKRDCDFVWVGTKNGPERKFIAPLGVKYYSIRAAKLRRYWSIKNFFDIFNFVAALAQSFYLLLKIKPDCMVSAGSSICVPLHIVGKLFSVPMLIHQQDVCPSFANILMAPMASKITVSLEKSVFQFPENKTKFTGNPSRSNLAADKEKSMEKFGIPSNAKVFLFMGGGLGAMRINTLVQSNIKEITSLGHVLHITGEEKFGRALEIAEENPKYHPFAFLTDNMKYALSAADIVISRAGFSTLTELAQLKKASVLIPIKGTHQEENAAYFAQKGAAVFLEEQEVSGTKIISIIKSIMENPKNKESLEKNIAEIFPAGAAQKIADEIYSLSSSKS